MNHKLSLLIMSFAIGVGTMGLDTLTLPVQAQRIVDVTPGLNSRNVSPETSISGVFENSPTESVKSGSVAIYLNGREITSRSTITRNFFSYRPSQPLAPGDYTVRVDYESSGGQLRSVSWMFNVQPEITLEIAQVTHNAAEGLGAGGTLVVTVNGTRSSQAAVVLVEDGRVVREIQAQEASPGVYTATLPVNPNGNLQEGIVIGRLKRQERTVYAAATRPAVFTQESATVAPPTQANVGQESVNSTAPAALLSPMVKSHKDGDRIDSRGFTLVGETSPNATVQVVVTASTPIFGVISLESSDLLDAEVVADAQGQFQIDVPSPAILQRGTRYNIELTAISGEQTSGTTQLELRQR